ncbi:MAG: electron transport complex subunit E [Desulfuromonadaceae bacterium]|nr:electron transport complex subunit E [Desulfuromonadaceae bacterium]
MNPVSELKRGIWTENAVLKLGLGLCPALATSSSVENGIGMGVAATFVLICSNVVISAMRKIIPSKVRIPAFIVIIASFVTVVDLVMAGFLPDLHKALGIFIPLIVVNCIILGRAEAYASKNAVLSSAVDGIVMGIGFTVALVAIASVREILGNGSFFGINILGSGFIPMLLMILPPGAFLAIAFLLAGMNQVSAEK